MFSVSVSGHRTHCFVTVPAGLFLTAAGLSLGGWATSFTLASPSVVRTEACDGLYSLNQRPPGLTWSAQDSPTFMPSPLRLRAQTARFTPRGLTEVVILVLWLGFPTGFRSSPDPLSTSSSLSSISRTREN